MSRYQTHHRPTPKSAASLPTQLGVRNPARWMSYTCLNPWCSVPSQELPPMEWPQQKRLHLLLLHSLSTLNSLPDSSFPPVLIQTHWRFPPICSPSILPSNTSQNQSLSITYPNYLTVPDITRFTIQSLSCYIHTKIHKHLHITFFIPSWHTTCTSYISHSNCDCTCDSLPQIWLWCASKDTLKFPLNTHQLQHTALGE